MKLSVHLISEGFKMVKFEHKKPTQIGSGFSKKLKRPWEMHVRLLDFNQGMIGIHAEVEISRNYFQHIKSVRVPVVYEIESILKKHRIEYQLWHSFIKDYITNIVDRSSNKNKNSQDSGIAMDWDARIYHHRCNSIRSEIFYGIEIIIGGTI